MTPAARVSASLLAAVWVIEVVRVFVPDSRLASLGLACLALFTLLAFTRASRHIAILALLAMGSAVAIAVTQGSGDALIAGLRRAQVFGAFFPAVLLLRATAEASPRILRVRGDVAGLGEVGAQNWTQYASHALGAVLNVGAMAILAPVVSRGAPEQQRLALARSSARGVGGAVMWSPFFLSLAFVSALVPRAPMWQSMIVGSGLALIGLALSYLLFTRGLGAPLYRESLRRLLPLAAPMSLVVGAVVAASLLLGWSGLVSVAIVVPLLCVAYVSSLGADEARSVARRALVSFARLSDELLIVLGASVLGAAIASLPAVQQLGGEVTPALVQGPLLLTCLVLVLLALGQLGLHPMIGASIVIPVVAAGDFGLCAVALVCAGVFAWALNASVSIWTLPVAVGASTFEVPAGQMFSRRTFQYLVWHAAGGIAYLAAANELLRRLGCG